MLELSNVSRELLRLASISLWAGPADDHGTKRLQKGLRGVSPPLSVLAWLAAVLRFECPVYQASPAPGMKENSQRNLHASWLSACSAFECASDRSRVARKVNQLCLRPSYLLCGLPIPSAIQQGVYRRWIQATSCPVDSRRHRKTKVRRKKRKNEAGVDCAVCSASSPSSISSWSYTCDHLRLPLKTVSYTASGTSGRGNESRGRIESVKLRSCSHSWVPGTLAKCRRRRQYGLGLLPEKTRFLFLFRSVRS